MRLNVRSEPARAVVREGVAPLFFALRNVAAVTKALNDALVTAGEEPALHANRLHTLLSDDLSRGLNRSTLELISRACELALAADPNLLLAAQTQLRALRAEVAKRGLEAPAAVSDALGLPPGLANLVVDGDDVAPRAGPPGQALAMRSVSEPDWSYQDVAVARCVASLSRRKDARVGLVLPTGAGKTRTALRVVLTMLAKYDDPTAVAVWVTHRLNLREQAFRELQKMIAARLPETLNFDAAALTERVKFQMVGEVGQLQTMPDAPPVVLVVIDEAHHAAAPSYQTALDATFSAPALFLTATPNRSDSQPIGMDEIAFTITHKELAERGAVLRPEFLDFPVEDFSWSSDAVEELADYIVGHTRHQFSKVLVLAPRVERVREFYDALVQRLCEEPDHPVLLNDIGYIVGAGNSLGIENEDFLGRFRMKGRGVIVSAQLLLEGFDDPNIDAVVITYQSTSVIRLMQAAGRAVRYAPGKRKAYVVQARNSDLAYHFDERWLYQDIDDYLRPGLIDRDYTSLAELRTLVERVLDEHNADSIARARALSQLESIAPGERCRLFLYGLPYFGRPEDFDSTAKWGALLETPSNSLAVRGLFNEFCRLGADLSDPSDFLVKEGAKFNLTHLTGRDGLWREVTGLLVSSYLAKAEMTRGDPKAAGENRPYSRASSSTWLRYVTFTHRPAVSPELATFLADCHNAPDIEAAYLESPEDWPAVVKVPLPLDRYEAHLVKAAPWAALRAAVQELRARLAEASAAEQVGQLAAFVATTRHMVEPRLLHRIEFLLSQAAWARQVLLLNQPTEHNHG